MPVDLPRLYPAADPNDRVKTQDTDFGYDVMPRYVCNNWDEILASQSNGGYPFDAIVIGAGMFGGYCAEKLYRRGAAAGLRILILEAGAFLLPTHIQNLPQRLGGKVGGADSNRNRDDGIVQNVVWGMPWISNEGFPGLAYCIGGRSLFWGGWSPRLTTADLDNWPLEIRDHLLGTNGNDGAYRKVEREIGAFPTEDYIHGPLYEKLKDAFDAAKPAVSTISDIEPAPLAVQGEPPGPGLFSFDKFSSGPFLLDAIRNDSGANSSHGDVSRRIFLVPRTQVLRLGRTGNAVTSIEIATNGQRKQLTIDPSCAVLVANGTIEASRLAMDSLGLGSSQFGTLRLGNLMAHLRSNITVRIKRNVLGLTSAPSELETAALLVRGTALGRRFHFQVTAAAVTGSDPETNLWSMNPDIDLLDDILANQEKDWIVFTFRGIGEMEENRTLPPDAARSWIDQSGETDGWGVRRAYANLVTTALDRKVWKAMDKAAFDFALKLAQNNSANIEYWSKAAGKWGAAPTPNPDPNVSDPWQDFLGTTHHEAGTLFMGEPGSSFTDTNGKLHGLANTYVVGPAIFPTLGSANPSLTALCLARRTAMAIVAKTNDPAAAYAAVGLNETDFTPLSLAPADWQMVRAPNTTASFKHYGEMLESIGFYGLYWYKKEAFDNFVLRVDWRIGRVDDNSGVYIRVPDAGVANALTEADAKGHEIQIDDRGFDSNNGTSGNNIKRTGAIYDLQAPTSFPSKAVGSWNTYFIEANGPNIKVTLNNVLVNEYRSTRQTSGFIALQAHAGTSRVQFRNLHIRKLT